jgi:GAF domain-containing protein
MQTNDGDRTSELVTVAAATETLAASGSHSALLALVVQIAARVIGAATASMLLLDRNTDELAFEVAYPHQVTTLKGVRVPLGEGVAGLVAMTGQPMAISDARSDPRHATTIAEQTGYRPDSLLCVPLLFGDEVIGVLELMDKQGAKGFNAEDMETLGLFAQLAAVAIEQSRTRGNLASLLKVASVSKPPDDVSQFVTGLEQEPRFKRTLELAQLVQQIGQAGDAELDACTGILRSFAAYARTHSPAWRPS